MNCEKIRERIPECLAGRLDKAARDSAVLTKEENRLLMMETQELIASPLHLWISKLDGSAMHEVGVIPSNLTDSGTAWAQALYPHWTPDGAGMTFAYHDAIWVTAVK